MASRLRLLYVVGPRMHASPLWEMLGVVLCTVDGIGLAVRKLALGGVS